MATLHRSLPVPDCLYLCATSAARKDWGERRLPLTKNLINSETSTTRTRLSCRIVIIPARASHHTPSPCCCSPSLMGGATKNKATVGNPDSFTVRILAADPDRERSHPRRSDLSEPPCTACLREGNFARVACTQSKMFSTWCQAHHSLVTDGAFLHCPCAFQCCCLGS